MVLTRFRVYNLPISNVIDIVQYKYFRWKMLMLCFLFAWSDPSSKFIKCFLVNSISFNFEPICFQKRLLHFELLAIATTYFPFLILTREHFSIFACRFQLISQIYNRLAIVTTQRKVHTYTSPKPKKQMRKWQDFIVFAKVIFLKTSTVLNSHQILSAEDLIFLLSK